MRSAFLDMLCVQLVFVTFCKILKCRRFFVSNRHANTRKLWEPGVQFSKSCFSCLSGMFPESNISCFVSNACCRSSRKSFLIIPSISSVGKLWAYVNELSDLWQEAEDVLYKSVFVCSPRIQSLTCFRITEQKRH